MPDEIIRLYTAEQVRGLDRCAIEAHGIAGMTLMERAGKCTFDLAREKYPASTRWLVFCGGGNNGGDGYVLARLAREAGLHVEVCALKEPSGLKGDAATAAKRWAKAGGQILSWPMDATGDHDLVFDALLGTGLDREPGGAYGEAVDFINQSGLPVIAVDVPTGLNSDSGVAMGRTVDARQTMTFIGRKRGLFTADGPDHAGEVAFSDLQTPGSVTDSEPDYGLLIEVNLIRKLLPRRTRNSHKGSFGWVLAVGGDRGMSGAVRLAGEAALRSGAGKVTVATREDHAALVNMGCPELMVRGVESAEQLGGLPGSTDVVMVGTGLGQSNWSNRMMDCSLQSGRPLVIDADGLNLLAARGASPGLPNAVLTPHPAEAARLLDSRASVVQQDRVGSAQAIARRYQAVSVLKGCGTVIAAPEGRYAICPYGNPGMATAGSGDVLSGVVAAMLAQGLDPWHGALAGVLAHALAGDAAARKLGERGLVASDITARLPTVLSD